METISENYNFADKTIGFAFTGSFCTINQSLEQLAALVKTGCNVIPIVSYSVASTDTRFGLAHDFIERIEALCQKKVIDSIAQAEPIGPKKLLDALVVMPCTGNTLAKLYCGITDTPVTMACKAHLRNKRPLLLGIATNDGLTMNAKNIGGLMNIENVFFIPYGQDDSNNKPSSLIADFSLLLDSLEVALEKKPLQPQLF